jgi:tetratricopeptide (TPR) repeat protein
MTPTATIRAMLAALCCVAAAIVPLAARQETDDDRVRELYARAEYEQALDAIGAAGDAMAEQYRALCLLALGRTADAEAAVRALVTAEPEFVVSDEEMPPRFVALFASVRRALLPALVRGLFADARELFQADAYDRALTAFEKVLRLSSSPEANELDGMSDLRLLASGFIDLARPRAAARPGPAPISAAAPARPPATATSPVATRQTIPPWPNEAGRAIFAQTGIVRLQINSRGQVTAAEMVRGLHPLYDRLVLAAAQEWEYTPATLNGVPVDSESVLEIRITPQDR